MAIKFRGKGLAKKYRDMARKMPGLKWDTLFDIAEDAKADFEKTVDTWDNKPEFVVEKRPRSLVVKTDDKIYHFVDGGTRAHVIRPVNAPMLAFSGSYQAKTTPRVIASRPGGRSGPVVFAAEVHHPGTEAREFSKIIHAKWERETVGRMREAFKNGLESVGL